MRAFLTSFALLIAGTLPSYGAAISSEGRDFFESKIRPVLVTECYKCHGAEKTKGGLRLDSRDAILKGGDSGAAIVPGDPDKSLLIESLAHTTKDEALFMP